MALTDESRGDDENIEEPRFRATNNGTDKRRAKPKPEIKRPPRKISRKVLKAEDMYLHQEEREMVVAEYNRSRDELIAKYGTFTAFMEYEVIALCYALVRMRRKARLESNFSRFFDRLAPHDPVAQITTIVKALGMLPDKKEQETAGASQEIRKILAADSEENEALESSGASNKVDYKTWLESRDMPLLQMRTPTTLPRYDDEQKLPIDEDAPEELDIEKINGDKDEESAD